MQYLADLGTGESQVNDLDIHCASKNLGVNRGIWRNIVPSVVLVCESIYDEHSERNKNFGSHFGEGEKTRRMLLPVGWANKLGNENR